MREIYIRKLSYEEARYKLEREIQSAFMEKISYVEVVHGIGEGILKKMVQDYVATQDYLRILPSMEEVVRTNPGTTKIEILLPRSR